MRVQEVYLKNFRVHKEYRATLHPHLNIFIGENGQGKTSVLEALSLCLRGRSFRQGRSWVQEGCQQSELFIKLKTEYGDGEIKVFLEKERTPCFSLYFNEKKTRSFPFQSLCIFSTPEDLNAVRGEALYRRKLLDELVIQNNPEVYRKFNKTLIQKNSFLKQNKQGKYNFKDQKEIYKSLQRIFKESAKALIEARFQALETIIPFWKKRGQFFLQTIDFEVQYLCQKKKVALTSQEAIKIFEKETFENEALERIKGCTLVGPHRDDLRFLYHNHEARENLSQGQQKALILSWKMAQWSQCFERNKPLVPSLFFDDVFSEIDQHYQKNLLEFLLENKAQSFLTVPTWTSSLLSKEGCVFDLGVRIQRELYDRRKTL